MLLAVAHDLIVLALLMIPLGAPLSPWLGALSASVQRAVPAASSTEAFAWTFAVITVAMAAGSATGGVVIQGTSPETAFLAAGGLGLAGAAFGALRKGLTKRSPTRHLRACHSGMRKQRPREDEDGGRPNPSWPA